MCHDHDDDRHAHLRAGPRPSQGLPPAASLLFRIWVIRSPTSTASGVGIARLTMSKDMPSFNDEVIGFGAGVFFVGYFLLEIPGALIVEWWSARKWISTIMIVWGIMAALTALVTVPWHFYGIRLLLGLAQAGFFPGITVYLTHWFPSRDRARALACFFLATPVAQIISPKISYQLLKIGTEGYPEVLGLVGWQWVYIFWGLPAVVLGVVVFVVLTDRPGQAKWLPPDEREALERQLKHERASRRGGKHMTVLQAMGNPRVLILAGAYFLVLTGAYGMVIFMPSILESWYKLSLDDLTWLVILPPIGWLCGLVFVGWNSDRTQERRLHTVLPIALGAASLVNSVAAGLAAALGRGRPVHPDRQRQRVSASLLGDSEPPSDRGGGGRLHWTDQLDREPRRPRRPVDPRHGQEEHRRLPPRHDDPGGLDGPWRHDHPEPRAGQASPARHRAAQAGAPRRDIAGTCVRVGVSGPEGAEEDSPGQRPGTIDDPDVFRPEGTEQESPGQRFGGRPDPTFPGCPEGAEQVLFRPFRASS